MFLPRKENIMLTKYEQKLIEYWANHKPGMGPFNKKETDVPDVEPEKEIIVDVNLDYLAEDIRDDIWDII